MGVNADLITERDPYDVDFDLIFPETGGVLAPLEGRDSPLVDQRTTHLPEVLWAGSLGDGALAPL